MRVVLSIPYLQSMGYSAYMVSLNDRRCQPMIIGDWMYFFFSYNSCLTKKQVERDSIIYTNKLIVQDAESTITHKKKMNLSLKCQKYKNAVVEGAYVANDTSGNTLTRYFLFHAMLGFFHTSDFTTEVHSFPYTVELNQELYVQAKLMTEDKDLVVFVETCVASPTRFDFANNIYYIIKNGCGVDGYKTYPSPSDNIARFGFKAFSFLDSGSNVFLKCQLAVCNKNTFPSRCSQGCTSRHKRAADSTYEKVKVLIGPIRMSGL
ncbi:hypothetical protein GDO86_013548 [Hymenochirus boettgeri]|uniref:ZP domain-containing protein n=1 Tax=Hymenochirus boettgeri TaxID=247094 RepID=A0A8T2IZ12_9PIPI|nr:hypothetical protein GDO86_013548 [Hymenochirus boettgeri]